MKNLERKYQNENQLNFTLIDNFDENENRNKILSPTLSSGVCVRTHLYGEGWIK